MLIFWHNGGVRIDPENEAETDALSLIFRNLKLDVPAILKAGSPEREAADLAAEEILCSDAVHGVGVSPVARNLDDKDSVIRIRISLEGISDRRSGGGPLDEPS